MDQTTTTHDPSAEVAPASPRENTEASVAWTVGGSLLLGLSTSPGIVSSLQYRTAGRHAFLVGARGGAYFPGRFTGTTAFGWLGAEVGYRGNLLAPARTELGILGLVAPGVAFGLDGESAFLSPVSLGGFFRYGAFELQLTAGGGPVFTAKGVGGVGLFGLAAGVTL